jgi:hypothetical protein
MSKEQQIVRLNSPSSPPHIIRLHGPWQCELLISGDAVERLTVQLPVDWSSFFRDRSGGSMIWRRSFGRPTNLDDQERVELIITNLQMDVMVELNGIQIDPFHRTDAIARFELTNRLKTRNRLAFEVHTPPLGGASIASPFGQVYIEILADANQV